MPVVGDELAEQSLPGSGMLALVKMHLLYQTFALLFQWIEKLWHIYFSSTDINFTVTINTVPFNYEHSSLVRLLRTQRIKPFLWCKWDNLICIKKEFSSLHWQCLHSIHSKYLSTHQDGIQIYSKITVTQNLGSLNKQVDRFLTPSNFS